MAAVYRVFRPNELQVNKLIPISAKLELVSLAILAPMLECNLRADIPPPGWALLTPAGMQEVFAYHHFRETHKFTCITGARDPTRAYF